LSRKLTSANSLNWAETGRRTEAAGQPGDPRGSFREGGETLETENLPGEEKEGDLKNSPRKAGDYFI